MPNYDIGTLIKKLRTQKGLSQYELADSIIDRANLSRIESGKAMPGKKTLEAIFERLGYNPNNIANFYLDEEAARFQKITDELDSHLANSRIEEADTLIARLESDDKYQQNGLNVQYILCAKAANAVNRQENPDKIMDLLNKAMRVSIPEYHERYIEDYLLTKQDQRILNMMAIVHSRNGQLDAAINIMTRLKVNFEKNCVDKTEMGRNYPLIIFTLVQFLHAAERYKEAFELCDAGIKVCRDTAFYFALPLLMANKADCLIELGETKVGKKLYRQAYIIFDAFGMQNDKKAIKNYAKEKLGIVLKE